MRLLLHLASSPAPVLTAAPSLLCVVCRFADIDWKKAAKRQLTPPYIPTIKDDGDTSNFDAYAEDKDPLTVPGPDPFKDIFRDF